MIASAQFTIISLCDVVTSDTPPENPYEGQLWVDTSVTPPETKIWDGNEWVVQNDIEAIRTTISILTEKDAQFQQTIDGLNSYVATLTEAVGNSVQRPGRPGGTGAELRKPCFGIGTHGEWTVRHHAGAVHRRHQLCAEFLRAERHHGRLELLRYGENGCLHRYAKQHHFRLLLCAGRILLVVAVHPRVWFPALIRSRFGPKKTSTMSGYFYVTYNGNKTKYLFNKSTAFDWTDYSVTLTDVTDPTLRIYCYCRDASIYLADIMISEGAIPRKVDACSPTRSTLQEVKIDKRGHRGIQQRIVPADGHHEHGFAGYYNDEVIFT